MPGLSVVSGVAHTGRVAPDADVQARASRPDKRERAREIHRHGDGVIGPERRDFAVGLVRAGVRRDRDRLDPHIGAHLQVERQIGGAAEPVRRPQRVAVPRQRAAIRAIRPRDRRRGRIQRIARRQRPRRRHRIADIVRRGRVRHLRQPVAHRTARVENDVRPRHPAPGRRRRVHLVARLGPHLAVVLAEARVPGPAAERAAADIGADIAAAQRVRRHAHPVGVAVPLLHRVAELQHVAFPRAGHLPPELAVVKSV